METEHVYLKSSQTKNDLIEHEYVDPRLSFMELGSDSKGNPQNHVIKKEKFNIL